MNSTNPQDIAALLSETPSVIVLLPKNPDLATVASGLGLFLALERAGKRAEIACPTSMLVEMNRLVGVQKIKDKLTGQNLVISFDYVKDAIEKVSYNVDNGKFNLVVVPKTGHTPLDPANVTFTNGGLNGDALILIGTQDINQVKSLFASDVNLDDRQMLAIVATPERSLAAEAAVLLSSLGINPDADIANNLFISLVNSTNNFASATAADFETAAALTRFGASSPAIDTAQEKITRESIVNPSTVIKSDWLKPKIFSSGKTT